MFAGIHEAFMNECITGREIHYLGSSNENHVVALLNQRTAVKYAYTVILSLVHASVLTLIRTVPPAHIEAGGCNTHSFGEAASALAHSGS